MEIAPAGPSTPVRGGKRRARDPLLQPQAKVGTGTGISDAGMGIRQEGRGIVQTVEEQGDSQGAQANPVIGKGISVSAVQSGQGEARAGALPSERLQTEQEQREGANSDGREAEGPMEASGTYGDSNAQGMGQGTREAEGTGLRQQPVTGEPAWLREMRTRYDQHEAMTPAGVVRSRNALTDVSVVIKTQRVPPCKKVAAVRIKTKRKDNGSGPGIRGKKAKPSVPSGPSGPTARPAQPGAGAPGRGRRHRDEDKDGGEVQQKRRRSERQQPKGYG